MDEFIKKLIERLEEEKEENPCRKIQCKECKYTHICYEGEQSGKVAIDNAISIVNELAEEYNNEFCEWKFIKSVADGGYIFNSGCNHKRFSDLHGFEYCPYCGKEIKVLSAEQPDSTTEAWKQQTMSRFERVE